MYASAAHTTGVACGCGVPTVVCDEEPLHGAVQLVRCALVGQTDEIGTTNHYPRSLDGAYTEAGALGLVDHESTESDEFGLAP